MQTQQAGRIYYKAHLVIWNSPKYSKKENQTSPSDKEVNRCHEKEQKEDGTMNAHS